MARTALEAAAVLAVVPGGAVAPADQAVPVQHPVHLLQPGLPELPARVVPVGIRDKAVTEIGSRGEWMMTSVILAISMTSTRCRRKRRLAS